jgi:hypothetical protein
MLAQRFNRINNPIRYALDPAHAQAVYNFLKMQSRVYGIPEMMGSQENRQLLGNAHPLGMELAQQLHHGDNEAAMVLPDLMEEHGAFPIAQVHPSIQGGNLLHVLQNMHGGTGGGNLLFQLLHGMRNRLSDPGQVRGYGDHGHEQYGAINAQHLRQLGNTARIATGHIPDMSRHRTMRLLADAVFHGTASAIPHLHDVAESEMSQPGSDAFLGRYADNTRRQSIGVMNHMNDFMSNYGG